MLLLRCSPNRPGNKNAVCSGQRGGAQPHENAFGSQLALVLQGCPLSDVWCFGTGTAFYRSPGFRSSVRTSYHPGPGQSRAISLNLGKSCELDSRRVNGTKMSEGRYISWRP